jgi:hypothetical protein
MQNGMKEQPTYKGSVFTITPVKDPTQYGSIDLFTKVKHVPGRL